MARFKRLEGYDVLYPTGPDEHGQKVEQAASSAGIDPQTFIDRISVDFQDTTARMGVSNDDWIRTTEPHHKPSRADVWQALPRLQNETEWLNRDKRQALVAGLGMPSG